MRYGPAAIDRLRVERHKKMVRDVAVDYIRTEIAEARQRGVNPIRIRVSDGQWAALDGITEIDGVQIERRRVRIAG